METGFFQAQEQEEANEASELTSPSLGLPRFNVSPYMVSPLVLLLLCPFIIWQMLCWEPQKSGRHRPTTAWLLLLRSIGSCPVLETKARCQVHVFISWSQVTDRLLWLVGDWEISQGMGLLVLALGKPWVNWNESIILFIFYETCFPGPGPFLDLHLLAP